MHLPDTVPRDVLANVHFYHIKDQLLRAARNACILPQPYTGVALYQDISAATEQRSKDFAPVTKVLQDRNLLYKWGFPTKLLVMHQNQQVDIASPKEGLKQLYNWVCVPSPPLNVARHDPPPKIPTLQEAPEHGYPRAPSP